MPSPKMCCVGSDALQGYLDGSLDEQTCQSVREHLDSCARCRAELEGWQTLFDGLSDMENLSPSTEFSRRVLEALPVVTDRRLPIAARLLTAFRRKKADTDLPIQTEHVAPGLLQDFLDQSLARGPASQVENHLRSCRLCREEADEWRALMVGLDEIPLHAPSPEFTERVMAHVRIQTAVTLTHPSVGEQTRRWFELNPKMKARIAGLAGAAVPPVGVLAFLVVTVLSHPLVSFESAVGYLSLQGGIGGQLAAVLERAVTMIGSFEVISPTSLPQLWLAGVTGFVALTCLSVWVLYRNLVTLPKRGAAHARF